MVREATYHKHLPGDTPVCTEPHHDVTCALPCPGCEADCDPRFRSTLEAVRRRAELDRELKAMGARVIRVKDLGAALEARDKGAALAEFVTRSLYHSSPLFPWTLPVRSYWQGAAAAHLARVALGEGGA